MKRECARSHKGRSVRFLPRAVYPSGLVARCPIVELCICDRRRMRVKKSRSKSSIVKSKIGGESGRGGSQLNNNSALLH